VNRVFHSLIIFLSWCAALLPKAEYLHRARFAHLHELTNLFSHTFEGASLLLGRGRLRGHYRVSQTPQRPELGNVLVVAPTRGGKGLLAVSQLLTWHHSAIVNDIKGELYEQTAGYRARLGPVFCLDPEGVGHRFDPLSTKTSEKDLLSAALHLLTRHNEGEGRIFSERAAVMLSYLFLAARLEGQPPFAYVRRLVHLGLPGAAGHLNALSPLLATQFLDMDYTQADFQEDRFLTSAWSTLSIRMRQLLTESVVRCLTGSDFTAAEIMRAPRPVTLYLRWPEQDLLVLSPLVRLLWQSLIGELVTTFDRARGKNCHPVLLLMDEAGVTEIPNLHLYAATVAGRNISLWAAVQDLAQLDGVYGTHRARTIRNNMDTKLFYRQADQETAEYIERALGKQSGFARSESQYGAEQTSSGLSEQAVPLLTAQEITQLHADEILYQHANYPKFRARRMDWRAYPQLVARRAIPPPVLAPLTVPLPRLPTVSGNNDPAGHPRAIDPDALT
jgi:type IV secretion system protein VirD4